VVTTKAIILARGLGRRMRSADPAAALSDAQAAVADAGVKGMISVGRPFLDFVISGLADAGITSICMVIGPEHEMIRERYAGIRRVSIRFVVQELPLGTSDAVASAEAFADGETSLVLNSDNYYPTAAVQALSHVGSSGLIGFSVEGLTRGGNIPPERISQFALVEMDAEGAMTAIHEKPDPATRSKLADSLVSMNLWSFTPAIFEACRRVTPSVRGELELQDAVRIAMTGLGERFQVLPYAGGVLDLSSRGDVADVARRLTEVPVAL
jgi:glucose-1-phosphate thymidylyltransferase